MSDETVKTYQENFGKYVERTPADIGGEFQVWMDAFISELPAEAKVLEFGSATGRDARYFRSRGITVMCTDIIPDALALLKKDGFETELFDFRNEPLPSWKNLFDGVFANAVFLHADTQTFEKILGWLPDVLTKDGVIAFSLKTGEGEAVTSEKMDAPRYFNYYTKERLLELLARFPYSVADIRSADNGKWIQVILRVSER